MEMILNKPKLSGTVRAVPSKSHAHRALICSAFADGITEFICSGTNEDIDATITCLGKIGAEISRKENGFTVKPGKANKKVTLNCGESGSTLRFLIPVVSSLGIEADFIMKGRLPERPLEPLKSLLESRGIVFSNPEKNVLRVSGKLDPGTFEYDGTVSSQFTTGLLLALGMCDGESKLILSGITASKPYIDMTVETMRSFGVKTAESGSSYTIHGGHYISPKSVVVEGDWSGAAFMLCAGALSDCGITVDRLDVNTTQGDSKILDILREMGASVSYGKSAVTVKKKNLHGICLDAENIPDLIPVVSALASVSAGTTKIYNCERLRHKESDRLEAIINMISSLGGRVELSGDTLIISGQDALEGGTISSYGDHRMAMSAAVAAIKCKKEVRIENAEAVNKSYPGFWTDYSALCKSGKVEGK